MKPASFKNINMKFIARIGWAFVAVAVVIAAWVIIGKTIHADEPYNETDSYGNILTIQDGELIDIDVKSSKVEIPSEVTSIAAGVFDGNGTIENVSAPGVTDLGKGVFKNCQALKEVSLNKATSIPDDTFYGCTSLSSLRLSENLSSIGDMSFYGCQNLESVTIPASVTSISTTAFSGCENLSAVRVESGNPNYSSDGTALYNKAGTELIYVPAAAASGASSYTVPDGVTIIDSRAFSDNTNIKELTIPASVKKIADGALSNSNVSTLHVVGSNTDVDWGNQGDSWYPSVVYVGDVSDIQVDFQNAPNYLYEELLSLYSNKGTVFYGAGDDPIDPTDPEDPDDPVDPVDPVDPDDRDYKITYGADGVIYNDYGAYTLTADGPYDKFDSLTIDGVNVSPSYYTVSGNESYTTVVLSSSYIKSLAKGAHSVKFVYKNNKIAATKLTIKKKSSGGGSSSSHKKKSGGSSDSTSGDAVTGNTTVIVQNGGTTTAAGTPATTATGTIHTKDKTPTTADGWDARLAFAVAMLICGVVVLMLSRRNQARLEVIEKEKK